MRKVVAYELLSLDGVAERPDEFVVTSTAPKLEWQQTSRVQDGLAECVLGLKQQSGGDIAVHGSIALTQSLLKAELVDELRLVIAPAVQIRGRRLFDDGSPRRLSLTRSLTSPSGYLLLDYHLG